MMPCSYLSTNYSLALSHLLSFFLPHQTPTPLLKQPIIPESKVSNVPLRASFWTLWNLKFHLKIPSFPGRKTEASFCQPRCPVWRWGTFLVFMERKEWVSPVLPTPLHYDHSKTFKQKRRGWLHRCPRGPAWPHCSGSSHWSHVLPHGFWVCIVIHRGRAVSSLCWEPGDSTSRRLLPQLQLKCLDSSL